MNLYNYCVFLLSFIFAMDAIDASLSWYKDGRLLSSSFLSKQSFDGRLARLVVSRVSAKDSGSYECLISNTGGEAKTKASLTVIGK